MKANHTTELFNIGLYEVRDVSRLIGLSSNRVSRWIFGNNNYEGLYTPKVVGFGKIISFQEMIEMLSIKKILEKGVSLQYMRKVKDKLVKEMGSEYPFSAKNLFKDGRRIIVEDDTDRYYEPFHSQYEAFHLIKQSLENIVYDEHINPQRWWIWGEEKNIIIDPKRSFGKPVDSESGIPTQILADALKANDNSVEIVANNFFVPAEVVKRASAFEASLST